MLFKCLINQKKKLPVVTLLHMKKLRLIQDSSDIQVHKVHLHLHTAMTTDYIK